jgi:tripeptidyl-peptidase-1
MLLLAADSYSLPRSIAQVVDFITPTIQPFAKMVNARRPSSLTPAKRADLSATGPVGCDVVTTPDCLKTLYNITYTPIAPDQNTLGIGKC